VEKETNTAKEMEADVREKLAPFNDVPIVFTSVTEKQRIHKALEVALEVYKNRTQRIKTNKLNEVMLPIIEHTPPPALKGKYIKIKYVQQLPTHAPTFAFYCNLPQYIKEPYRRFVENQMRKHFNFTGVPIQVFFRKK
jgi:GTP-binding protein